MTLVTHLYKAIYRGNTVSPVTIVTTDRAWENNPQGTQYVIGSYVWYIILYTYKFTLKMNQMYIW